MQDQSPSTDEQSSSGKTRGTQANLIGYAWCAAAILLCEALLFRYFFQYGISNIAAIDGASQQFPAYLYLQEWWKAALTGHGAAYGMWSWRLGLGGDVLSALHWHLADPFALLHLLVPARLLEYLYEALYFVRVLCAGLAAYAYFRVMKATRFAASAGSLVYVFSAFLMDLTIRQPFFVNPMIWLPLILIGIDLVIARRRWYLLVVMLGVAAASNFYFFYQIGLIAVIYAVARWAETTQPGARLRRLLPDGLRIGGWFLLGVSLAAWMLIPVALAVMASSRITAHYEMRWLYPIHEYLSYVVALVSARRGAHSLDAGFAVLGMFAVLVVFLRRGNKALKVMLGSLAAVVALPVLGMLFNEFTFPRYRFMFMAGIFLGAAVAILLSDTRPLSKRELRITGIVFVVFAALDVAACLRLQNSLLLVGVPLSIGALTWLLFALEARAAGVTVGEDVAEDEPPALRADGWPNLWRLGVVVLLVAGIAANGVASLDKRYNPILETFLPFGTAYSWYANDAGSQVKSLPTEGLQRIDKQRGVLGSDLGESQNNDPLAQGFAGLDYYYSIMADGPHQYTKALADRPKRLGWDLEGFDDRAVLDTLNAVRYYISPAQGAAYVPYGFAPVSQLGTQTVYENRNLLPVGYVYHSVVSPTTFGPLGPVDKQQALLQGVVIEDGQAPDVPRVQPSMDSVEVTYTLVPGDRLNWDQAARTIAVNKVSAVSTLTFSPVKVAETYLEMDGVDFEGGDQLAVAATGPGPRKTNWFVNKDREYFWGDQTLLINLGYSPSGITSATIGFLDKAKVRYGALKIIAIPMTHYAERVQRLAAEGMRDVRVGTDTLSGTVTSNGTGVLFLSVPYSKGWSATIDGAPTTILLANEGFSAVPIATGTHRVEFRYRAPGFRLGALITLIALAVAVVLAVATEVRLAAARRVRPRATSGDAE